MESKDAGDNGKKDFGRPDELRLPDEFFIVFIYGQRNDLYRSYDVTTDMNEGTQQWLMWGLLLKKATDSSAEEQLYERVLSFSQVTVNLDASWSSLENKFCII